MTFENVVCSGFLPPGEGTPASADLRAKAFCFIPRCLQPNDRGRAQVRKPGFSSIGGRRKSDEGASGSGPWTVVVSSATTAKCSADH